MFDDVHREEAPNVGDPEDASLSELHGVAPPCEMCGHREAVDGRGRCEDCLDDKEADRA